jgi:hypothetical protein
VTIRPRNFEELTINSYIPGYIHAFYLLHIWQDRRKQYLTGNPPKSRAPFVFSEKIQSGGSWGAAYRRNKNAEQTRLLKVRAAASPGVKADNAAQEKVGGKKAGVEEPAMVLLETLSPQQPAIRVEIDVAAARKK